MLKKLTSRKFLICLAAFLASVGTSIAGIHSSNEVVVGIGTVSTILSAAIYAFAEAWVDGKALDNEEDRP
jgi:hypothetical protein